MKKPAVSPLWLFTGFFLAAMFLPRLVTMGMFGDGLLYASMARNLAEGNGSLWAPFFSTGYFVDFASGNPYFENPPLMIWLQAGFFRLLGDPWWVEKLYALLLFLLNAWLIVRVWEIPLRDTVFEKKYGWLPLLLWYIIPTVIWGNPNNLMDNNLLTFCLLALGCALDGVFSGNKIWLKMTLAGVCVYLGFMTKGPVALYPVAAPFMFAAAGLTTSSRLTGSAKVPAQDLTTFQKLSNHRIFWGILQSTWIGLVAAGLFVLMLALIPDARTYFENYWEKRLGVVISGAREDAALTGWARLSIFAILAKELAGLIVVTLLVFFISGKKRTLTAHSDSEAVTQSHRLTKNTRKISLLFLLTGLSATLPLIASARQSGMYIIAGLPMFALAAGYFCLPLLHHGLEKPGARTARFFERLRVFSIAAIFVLAGYVLFLFGKPGREKSLLHDLPYIQKVIPKGEKVAVCDGLMKNLHAHTYLQRFHHLELTRDFATCRYALTDRNCDAEAQGILQQNGFERADNKTSGSTESHFIYLKK
ncbi:MAG TPA: glycosyltransferase family 39 protein [Saprospiraceae bacterium]|nr:glycosyltransferase family 39 protein [Saprospiraceae bacterium]